MSSDPLLRDLSISEAQGVQFAVCQRWLANLADGISSGSGGPGGVIQSQAELAAIPTVDLTPPVLKIYVDESTGNLAVWRLLTSTEATGPGAQRPNDYTALAPKVWFLAGT